MSSLIETSSSLLQSPVHTARAEAGTRAPNRASAAKTRANTRGLRWGRIDMIAQRYATELSIVRAAFPGSANHPYARRVVVGETGKDGAGIGIPEMARDDLRKERPEVGCHGEIAALEQGRFGQARPSTVHLATAHGTAGDEHGRAVAVIGAAGPVLMQGPAELAHRQHADVRKAIAQVGAQGGNRVGEIAQQVRQRPFTPAL